MLGNTFLDRDGEKVWLSHLPNPKNSVCARQPERNSFDEYICNFSHAEIHHSRTPTVLNRQVVGKTIAMRAFHSATHDCIWCKLFSKMNVQYHNFYTGIYMADIDSE